MNENTDKKLLAKNNCHSIFLKIKQFFTKLFYKDTSKKTSTRQEPLNNITRYKNKNQFIEQIKKIDDEETLLLKLQNKYRNGEIKEEDMTEEQINALCMLYDKQIAELRKSNNLRKHRLLEYKRKLQSD